MMKEIYYSIRCKYQKDYYMSKTDYGSLKTYIPVLSTDDLSVIVIKPICKECLPEPTSYFTF